VPRVQSGEYGRPSFQIARQAGKGTRRDVDDVGVELSQRRGERRSKHRGQPVDMARARRRRGCDAALQRPTFRLGDDVADSLGRLGRRRLIARDDCEQPDVVALAEERQKRSERQAKAVRRRQRRLLRADEDAHQPRRSANAIASRQMAA
jgi:hypothetical protein